MSFQTTEQTAELEWDLTDRLRKALRIADLSVTELAGDLGYTPQAIRNYLSGRRVPRRPIVIAWAMRCGVPVAWLETGEEPNDGPDTGPGQVIDGTGCFSRTAEHRGRGNVTPLRATGTDG